MIAIGRPYVSIEDGAASLNAKVSVDNLQAVLWLKVDGGYADCLCDERSDAFLLGLLPYAMQYRHDIHCEAPVTRRLRDQIEQCFLEPYCLVNPGTYKPAIKCCAAGEVAHVRDAIATGVSCGVDSLHVFATRPGITHGCVFNMFVRNHMRGEKERKLMWANARERARRFCRDAGVELVEVDTNFDKGIFPGLVYEYHVTFANLFAIYGLQKLFSLYFVASGSAAGNWTLQTPLTDDCAHYDHVLLPAASLSRIMIRLCGAEDRLDKVRKLTGYEPAKNHLNACWECVDGGTNCTFRCGKCKRTLLELEALDAVEDFRKVFDLEYYSRNKRDYFLEYYSGLKRKDEYVLELKDLLDAKFRKQPLMDKAYIYAHYWGMRAVVALLRIGTVRGVWRFLRDNVLRRERDGSRRDA